MVVVRHKRPFFATQRANSRTFFCPYKMRDPLFFPIRQGVGLGMKFAIGPGVRHSLLSVFSVTSTIFLIDTRPFVRVVCVGKSSPRIVLVSAFSDLLRHGAWNPSISILIVFVAVPNTQIAFSAAGCNGTVKFSFCGAPSTGAVHPAGPFAEG